MSSYVTNNNTRRTKRARVYGLHAESGNNLIGSNANKSLEHNDAIRANRIKTSLVDTQIGSHNSKGLVIVGGANRPNFGLDYDPDDRSILLGTSGTDFLTGLQKDQLVNPPYPISFSGPGYLAFQNEVAIPTVKGNMIVTGDLQVEGDFIYTNKALLGAPPFIPVITDSLGNQLDGAVAAPVYGLHNSQDYFEVKITWTGTTNLVPLNALRLVGLPYNNYSTTSSPRMVPLGGVFTQEIGAGFHVQIVSGQSYFELEEVSYTSGAAPVPLTVENLASSGSLLISGWLLKV